MLSLAVVFVISSFTASNTNIETQKETALPASCLLIAYNQASDLVPYEAGIEAWTAVFTRLFDSCNDTVEG